MTNKYLNIDHLEEISFYEALEYYSSGVQVEVHLEDMDGIIQEYNNYFIQDGLDKGVTFLELIAGKWYVNKLSLTRQDGIYFEEFDEGEM